MSYPVVPVISSSSDVVESVNRIQCYLQELQYPGLIVQSVVMMLTHIRYNHTGTQFFDIKKYRSLSWLMETAKEMIRMSLPIKCLEAFILSLYPIDINVQTIRVLYHVKIFYCVTKSTATICN